MNKYKKVLIWFIFNKIYYKYLLKKILKDLLYKIWNNKIKKMIFSNYEKYYWEYTK